eukprot:3439753-Amphidinium_carterae.1
MKDKGTRIILNKYEYYTSASFKLRGSLQEYDARADLYSFGVLMWVLTTGGLRHKPGLPPTAGQAGDHFQASMRLCSSTDELGEALACCAWPSGFSTAGVQPLPTLELEQLVRSLVQRDFQERPEHAAIRARALLQHVSNEGTKAWGSY